nr:hypothetical protein [Candidatus Wallbacteria bacterium]
YKRIPDQRPTFYYTVERDFPGQRNQQLKDHRGVSISSCNSTFYSSLLKQGCGMLSDGRTVNVIREEKFAVLPKGCLGITKSGYHVIPFHTLAINPKEMLYGEVYYIPGTRGLKLPGGEIHDGFWFAHDTGSAFRESSNRIDMYVKNASGRKMFEQQKLVSHKPLRVYHVDARTRDKVYRKYKKFLINANKKKV